MKIEDYNNLVENFNEFESFVFDHIEKYKEYYGDGSYVSKIDCLDDSTIELSGVDTWRYGGREDYSLTIEISDLFNEGRMDEKLKKVQDKLIKKENNEKRRKKREHNKELKAARKLLKDNNEL